ncbi:chitinase [Mycobacteroides salmoniphilum]|uniref:glycoside hydrolase family 19 protein n=1 Tax=Mycobacteroides salmoniphilum TaxID=404941 RepID=UPI003561ED01
MPTRHDVENAKNLVRERLGAPYRYGEMFDPYDLRQGTDCSGVWQDTLATALGRLIWGREAEGATTENYRYIPVGGVGPFGTIRVARLQDIPADATAKLAFHHEGNGGASSHMWGELDGMRIESAGSKGLVTGEQAWAIDNPYASAWAYLPGPIDEHDDSRAIEILLRAMYPTFVTTERLSALLPALAACLDECDCDTVERRAMWFAQNGHESVGLQYFTELGNDAYFAQYNNRPELGNGPTDGPLFRGRGPIQVTGRRNYTALSQWAYAQGLVPTPTFFVDDPTQLASDRYGFIGVTWYWTTQRPMNDYADRRDIEGGSRAVNGTNPNTGRANGIDDRITRYNLALSLGDQLLEITTTGDDFMTALSTDEQREILDLLRWLAAPNTGELRKRFPSRSPLRHLGEGLIDTAVGVGLNDDANDHVVLVKELASVGDPGALALLREVAGADPVKYPDRQADRVLAQRILDALTTKPTPTQQTPTPVAGGASSCALTGAKCALVAEPGK